MPSAEKSEALSVSARVVEALPNALYRVLLLTEKRTHATVHAASAALLRLLPGDEVVVELMPYDPTRGRIVSKKS